MGYKRISAMRVKVASVKRFCVAISIIILVWSVCYGCGKEHENGQKKESLFKPISTIELVSAGETIKHGSGRQEKWEIISLSEDEYNTQYYGYKVQWNPPKSEKLTEIPKGYDGETSFIIYSKEYLSNSVMWKYYYIPAVGLSAQRYLKARVIGYNYTIWYAHVIDSTTVVLRGPNGDTTYTVTSFRVKYIESN